MVRVLALMVVVWVRIPARLDRLEPLDGVLEVDLAAQLVPF